MGRPRDTSIDARVLTAARRLRAEHGDGGISMAAVAASAGVTRAALYRRWPNRAALLFETQTNDSVPTHLPDLGSIRAELVGAVTHLVHTLLANDPDLAADQLGTMIRDRSFAERVWEQRWRPDRDVVHRIWERGVDRGEVRTDLDGGTFLDDIVAICLFRVHLLHRPPGAREIEELVDRLLDGVRP